MSMRGGGWELIKQKSSFFCWIWSMNNDLDTSECLTVTLTCNFSASNRVAGAWSALYCTAGTQAIWCQILERRKQEQEMGQQSWCMRRGFQYSAGSWHWSFSCCRVNDSCFKTMKQPKDLLTIQTYPHRSWWHVVLKHRSQETHFQHYNRAFSVGLCA